MVAFCKQQFHNVVKHLYLMLGDHIGGSLKVQCVCKQIFKEARYLRKPA